MRRNALALALVALLVAAVAAQDYPGDLQSIYEDFTGLRGRAGAFGQAIRHSSVDSAGAVERDLLHVQARLYRLPYGRLDPDLQLDYDILDALIRRSLGAHRSAMKATAAMEALPFEETARAMAAVPSDSPLVVPLFLARCEDIAKEAMQVPSAGDFSRFREAQAVSRRVEDAARIVRIAARRARRAADESDRAAIEKASKRVQEALAAYGAVVAEIGAALPGADRPWAAGADRFTFMIRHNDLIEQTPDELIQMAGDLLRQTHREMDDLANRISPGETADQVWREMQQDHPVRGGIVELATRNMDEAVALIEKEGFVTIPDFIGKCTVREVGEEGAPFYPFGAYSGGGLRGDRYVGSYIVNPGYDSMGEERLAKHLEANNVYWSRVVAGHEAYPGHHLQGGYASMIPDPIRAGLYSNTFIEGWGLYTEELMYRHGFFPDDRYRLAQLKMRAWRCVRVIVDCSLHCKQMTEDEAVEMLMKEVGLERVSAEAEVRRYTYSPTQPLSYIVGWTQLSELADEYREKMGDAYSERDFHDELLSIGSLPVSLIRKRMLQDPPPVPVYKQQ